MKAMQFSFALIIIISGLIHPQTSILIKSGFNFTSLTNSGKYSYYKTTPGLELGADYEIPLLTSLQVVPGAFYIQRKFEFSEGAFDKESRYKIEYDYLSFSLKLKFNVPFKSVNIFAYSGIQVSHYLTGKETIKRYSSYSGAVTVERDPGNATETFDLGIVIGNGLNLKLSSITSLTFTGEYYSGLTNFHKSETVCDEFSSLGFHSGLSFRIK